MTKEELKAKLHNYEERLKDVAKAIKETREQLAEAEKPKLRHGDFGMNRIFPRIVINGAIYNASGEFIRNVDDGAIGKHCAEIWFGNVFDLMKGWDKPFKEYDADKYATGIRIGDNGKIRIYACTGTDCKKEKCFAPLFLKEAEDFHNALGHAIADLKQKQIKEGRLSK